MTLLLFDYVIQHLSRISRIIFKPYGNGLLIGIGGNGRRSLSKLAAFINEYATFKIEMHKAYGKYEWSEDLKSLYKMIGLDNKKVVFTF
jgi:dynein heavy chain